MKGHHYTPEERSFMIAYVPGHSHAEIKEAFINKFGWQITIEQVRAYIKNNHLNTGRTGRFEKGHVPMNKGKKGICSPGSKKGWFKKGNMPHNHRPVGSERINVDGYIEVKVSEPNKWKLKHRIVYEQHYGEIPKGQVIIFKDGDKTNVDIGNLILISQGANLFLNKSGLCEYRDDLKITAVQIAELNNVTSKAKKRVKKNK